MDDKDLPIIYDGKDIEHIIHMLVVDSISKILTDSPADKALDSTSTTEKNMAWIEVYDDVLDEAYDMSQEYKEYE